MEIASGRSIRDFMSVPSDMYFTMDAKVSRFDFRQIAQNTFDSLLTAMAEDIEKI